MARPRQSPPAFPCSLRAWRYQAEGEKQSAILAAEGKREAAFREAGARERSAEAKATHLVSDATTSPNAKTILFPVEATQLIGTLGGIAELAREAPGGPISPPVTPPAAPPSGRPRASVPRTARE